MDIGDTSSSSCAGAICPLLTISRINYNHKHVSKKLIRYEFIDDRVELKNTGGNRYTPLHIIIKSSTARISKLHYIINDKLITTIDVMLLPYFKYEVLDGCTIYDLKELEVLIGNIYCNKTNKIRFDLELSEPAQAYMNGLTIFDCDEVYKNLPELEYEITRFHYVDITPKGPNSTYELRIDMEGCLNGFYVSNISNIKTITVHMCGVKDTHIVTKLYDIDIMMYCTKYSLNKGSEVSKMSSEGVYVPVDISNPDNNVISGSSWCCNRTPGLRFTIETKEPISSNFQLVFPLIYKMSYKQGTYEVLWSGGDIGGFTVRDRDVKMNYTHRIREPT